MKEFNIDTTRLHEGELLTHRIARQELWRFGKVAFFLQDAVEGLVIFAFSSPALARFFVTHENFEIMDAELTVQQKIPERTAGTKVLKLTLHTREVVIINEDDSIYLGKPLHPRALEYTGRLLTPFQIWGGEPLSYLSLILLSERLVDTIEDISGNENQLNLLHVMWQEYQLALKSHQKDQTGSYKILGEFVEFRAKRIRGLFVLFDM